MSLPEKITCEDVIWAGAMRCKHNALEVLQMRRKLAASYNEHAEMRAALDDARRRLLLIRDDIGNVEWGTPEHGAELFTAFIEKHYAPIRDMLNELAQKYGSARLETPAPDSEVQG